MEFNDGPHRGSPSAVSSAPSIPAEIPRPRPYLNQSVRDPQGPAAAMPRSAPRPGPVLAPDGTSPARRPVRRPAGRHGHLVGAIIGDELRIPTLWCQFGSCIARFTHRAALGERDLRARALAAGWHYDALGRLACPDCAQHDPTFWITCPPVPVTRHRAG